LPEILAVQYRLHAMQAQQRLREPPIKSGEEG
jgi:hypothetical protein